MNKLLPILLVVLLSGCGSDANENFYATCTFERGTHPADGFIPKLEIEYSSGLFNNKFFVNGFEASDVLTTETFAMGKFINSNGSSHKMHYQRDTNRFDMEDLDKHGKIEHIWNYKCSNKYLKQVSVAHPEATSIQWEKGYKLGYFNNLTSSQLNNFDKDFRNGYLYASSESSCHNYMIVGEWRKFTRESCESFLSTSKYLHGKQGVISPNSVSCSDKSKVWSNCLGYTPKYYGKFKNNRPHDFGRFTMKNGIAVGSINDGQLNGKVVEEFKDGEVREATWVNGKIEGEATVRRGSISEIYLYQNGKLISKKSNSNNADNSQETFRTMFQLLDLMNRAYH